MAPYPHETYHYDHNSTFLLISPSLSLFKLVRNFPPVPLDPFSTCKLVSVHQSLPPSPRRLHLRHRKANHDPSPVQSHSKVLGLLVLVLRLLFNPV